MRRPIEPWARAAQGDISPPKGFGELVRSILLDRYAPPSVLIDANYACLGCFGPVDRYLEPGARQTVPHLLAGLRPELRPRVHSAAMGADEAADARSSGLSVSVVPIRKGGAELFLVSFLDAQPSEGERRDSVGLSRQMSIAAGPKRSGFYPADREAADQIGDLSPRQRAVLDLLFMGYSNKQIAAELGISRRTVESHRAIVMRKLDVRTFADLIRLAATA